MALKITPIAFSEIDAHQTKTLITQYKNGAIVSFSYGEPDERDDSSYWYHSDGIGLICLNSDAFSRIQSIYVVEVA